LVSAARRLEIPARTELAVVLGHELGHVNARHSVRRMSQMMLAQVGLAVGSVVNETFAKISGLAGVGMQILFLKYSRDDEYQAASQNFSRYDSEFRRTTQSFAELRDPKFLRRQPVRIRLVKADGRQTLQDIFVRAGMKKESWSAFAIMNGMELGAAPPAGRLIKIVS
jgi:predicted Zn-dependent protease